MQNILVLLIHLKNIQNIVIPKTNKQNDDTK